MIVLGIDPGISNTGYGVVERRGGVLFALDGGVCVTSPELPLEDRLAIIMDCIEGLIDEHRPEAMAIESIYFGKNAQTAFLVGQARGAVVAAAGRRAVPVTSYTPQQIKLAVCGSGAAAKDQVQRMVTALLDLAGPLPPDHAADALAVGICHVNGASLKQAIEATA
ncbi:MAG TPA: crossover junction endodeoxyribonuclease RuvC [Solirubrobacterales bacterium]|jgi:crossover junction endodeoxyribonuclease RuvC|nr:crossover junction endodeoxyribonuclease RuvC [Solirubrobacterales bacterium]